MECIYCGRDFKAGEPCPECSNLTLDRALVKFGNDIYRSALYLEHLEGLHLVVGNGHHMAQAVTEFATNLLKERWRGKA